MLGAELGQMPAWYVELSYALALEQCALLQQQPKSPALLALQQGMLLWVSAQQATLEHYNKSHNPARGYSSLCDGRNIVVLFLMPCNRLLSCPDMVAWLDTMAAAVKLCSRLCTLDGFALT